MPQTCKMEAGNVICSACETDPAELVCFCSFPLVKLCPGLCFSKHCLQPRFHFPAAISITPLISRDNFYEWHYHLLSLTQAQQMLKNSLASIDAFTAEVEAACIQVERVIQECRSAVQVWKQEVSDLVQVAIAETMSQAFSTQPDFSCMLSASVWNHTANTPLYSTSLRFPDREDILELLSIRVEPISPCLPQFPLACMNPALALSGPMNVFNLIYPKPPIAPSTYISTLCRTCQAELILMDTAYQCPSSCQCRRCVIQSLTSTPSSPCVYCGQSYSPETVARVTYDYKTCHVCGLAVPVGEIESAANCILCRLCVSTAETTILGMTLSLTGTCQECNPNISFNIEKGNYQGRGRALVGRDKRIWGCCDLDIGGSSRLPCDHYVCWTHMADLKRCRSCQRAV